MTQDVREVAAAAQKRQRAGLKPYMSREEVLDILIDYQDRVCKGFMMRRAVEKDWYVQDAYDQAKRIVLSTPLAPED